MYPHCHRDTSGRPAHRCARRYGAGEHLVEKRLGIRIKAVEEIDAEPRFELGGTGLRAMEESTLKSGPSLRPNGDVRGQLLGVLPGHTIKRADTVLNGRVKELFSHNPVPSLRLNPLDSLGESLQVIPSATSGAIAIRTKNVITTPAGHTRVVILLGLFGVVKLRGLGTLLHLIRHVVHVDLEFAVFLTLDR